jgi:two-component system sensor histidine kinase QseC
MKSIRTNLLVSVLAVFVGALLLLAFLSYKETIHEVEEVFDAELAQTARMISQFTLSNIDSRGTEEAISVDSQNVGHRYEKHISYQVWFRNALVLRSESAPDDIHMSDVSGYSDVSINNQPWRVFALYPENSPYRIYTAEDYKARNELAFEIIVESLEVYFWSIPVLAILIYLTLSKGLVPLQRISEDLGLRDVHELKPIELEQAPVEIQPLVNALNALLAKLDAAMLAEKRFTADASHELRTPLSGIRLHAQLAIQAQNENDRRHALQQIIKAVDHNTHMIEQLLTLARLDPEISNIELEAVNLNGLCDEVVNQISKTITGNQQSITRHCPDTDITVRTNRNLLLTMIRNLLENASIHSGKGSVITLDISSEADSVIVTVEDNGPGIPKSQLNMVSQRFYRISGQEIEGSGLGLSIVTEAAKKLGFGFTLNDSSRYSSGLSAQIVIPLHRSPSHAS